MCYFRSAGPVQLFLGGGTNWAGASCATGRGGWVFQKEEIPHARVRRLRLSCKELQWTESCGKNEVMGISSSQVMLAR